jgi:hypothetical protein
VDGSVSAWCASFCLEASENVQSGAWTKKGTKNNKSKSPITKHHVHNKYIAVRTPIETYMGSSESSRCLLRACQRIESGRSAVTKKESKSMRVNCSGCKRRGLADSISRDEHHPCAHQDGCPGASERCLT